MASSQPARPAMAPARMKAMIRSAVDADAGAEGRGGVAADHDEMAAERRLGQDESEDDDRAGSRSRRVSGTPSRRWIAERRGSLGQVLGRAAAGDGEHQAAHPDVGGERDDEGVDLEPDDEEAVERADQRADGSASSERHRQRQPGRVELQGRCRCRAEQNRMPTAMAASAVTEFDREVHVAGDDDQRQADRHDADEGRLLDDVGEDADLEIVRDRRARTRPARRPG